MKRWIVISIILLHLTTGCLFANGGGYHYGVKFTGSIVPFTAVGTENVQILDEKLDIILGEKSAKVSVLYTMKNVSDKRVKVKFGFPVEDVIDSWNVIEGNSSRASEPLYTKDYLVTMNGEVLKHGFMAEPFGAGKNPKLKPFKGSEILKDIKGWQISEMTLNKGETIKLHIAYYSQYDRESASISDDVTNAAQVFKYRLSTGAVWHGPIKQGRVTISYAKTLNSKGVRVVKPVNRFKIIEEKYVWEFKDLEPTLGDDITFQAKPEESEYGYYGDDKRVLAYVKLDQKWFIKHTKYSVKATSTLADQGDHSYKADNLKKPWEGIWSEGAKGSGVDESLLITLNRPTRLAAVSLINGYKHDTSLFKKNNRIKSAELLINDKVKELITLADMVDEKRYFLNYKRPVKTMKLTIKSVYKGTKYDDTCLSFFGLLERIAKEPKTYGAR
ncbi:MAG: hypothetical protein ACI9E1_001761 [Cryomorphaceae bacterium]|jgi:hypothetical protein